MVNKQERDSVYSGKYSWEPDYYLGLSFWHTNILISIFIRYPGVTWKHSPFSYYSEDVTHSISNGQKQVYPITLMLAVFHVVAPLPGPGLYYCACLAHCHGLLGHPKWDRAIINVISYTWQVKLTSVGNIYIRCCDPLLNKSLYWKRSPQIILFIFCLRKHTFICD